MCPMENFKKKWAILIMDPAISVLNKHLKSSYGDNASFKDPVVRPLRVGGTSVSVCACMGP